MKTLSIAAAAALSLAAAGMAYAGVGQPLPQALAGQAVAAGGMQATPVYYRHWHRHWYRPGYPGRYVYGYAPRDWTTRCMEDLGYGRRGMYGCGR